MTKINLLLKKSHLWKMTMMILIKILIRTKKKALKKKIKKAYYQIIMIIIVIKLNYQNYSRVKHFFLKIIKTAYRI